MDRITKDDVQQLADISAQRCVSIYFPTERAGREVRQNSIRMKNLLTATEQQMREQGSSHDDIIATLKASRELVDDDDFWQHQSDGFALFATNNATRYYRLPILFDELAVVGDRFHLKPLLQLIAVDGKFFVLALSQNQVRLFEANRQAIDELEVEGMPQNLAEALKYDDPEKSIQFRQGGAEVVGSEAGDARAAIFHGHGAAKEPRKDQLLRYFQQIDRALGKTLAGERAPLVLAGVDYYFPIYREAANYEPITDAGIAGNPEHLDADQIHTRAWQIVEPVFQQDLAKARDNFLHAAANGKASSSVDMIVRAAHMGRVGTLFVERSRQQWGSIDAEGGQVAVHDRRQKGDQDLLDYAAIRTFATDGTVYSLEKDEMPDDCPAAAIYRF